MHIKLNLARNTLIFYGLLSPFLIGGSLYNFYGLISGKSSVVVFGAFALMGFILLPALLVATFLRNRCTISDDKITIGATAYPFTAFRFYIREQELPFKDRPLFSLFRSKYYDLIIRSNASGEVVYEKDLDITRSKIEVMRKALPLP